MKLNKVIQRLLIFFIGLPTVLFIAAFPWQKHLLLHLTITVVSAVASIEFYNILSARTKMNNKILLLIMTIILPIIAFCCSFFNLSNEIITFSFIVIFAVLMAIEIISPVFEKEENGQYFIHSNTRMAASVLLVLYCGFLLTFISRMSEWQNSTQFILIFLLMVFICDSFAWLFGMLLGKTTRGFFKASPNKSIVGFIFGIIGSILCGLLGYWFWPEVFTGSIFKVVIIGFFVGVAAIIGDLIESVIKRSSNFKDSGSIILGRGGILDSIDSIVVAAPVYYFLVKVIYGI